MKGKLWWLWLLLLLGLPRPGQAQTKSYYWERSDVQITLRENGDMDFVESHTLLFSGEPFTFGFRELPSGAPHNFVNNDGLSNITVSEGDRPFTLSRRETPGTYTIIDNNIYQTIYWYFEPTLGSHTYTITYTVKGGIIVDPSGDQLFWEVIPYDHAEPIQNGTITLRLPDGLRPQTITGTDSPLVTSYVSGREGAKSQFTISEDGQTIQFTLTEPLAAYEKWEIRAQFPHSLPIPIPDWQQRELRAESRRLLWPVIALLVLIGGALAILLLWFLGGRDPDPGPVPAYLTAPPDNLSPAVIGSLIDEQVNLQDILALFIDLARRGYLVIHHTKQGISFERQAKDERELQPFELAFLQLVFLGKQTSTTLTELHYQIGLQLPQLRQLLDRELEQQGLVRRSPGVVRRQYQLGAGLLVGLALAAYPLSVHYLERFAVFSYGFFPAGWLTLVLLILGGTLFYVSRHMPAKTAKGALAMAAWLAFRRYLSEIDQKRDLAEIGDLFEKFLPYAIAFGLERQWITKFAQVKQTPAPSWYQLAVTRPDPPPTTATPTALTTSSPTTNNPVPTPPAPAGLDKLSTNLTTSLQSMSDGLTRMLTATAATLKTAPVSGGGTAGSGSPSHSTVRGGSRSSSSPGFSSGRSGGGGRIGFG